MESQTWEERKHRIQSGELLDVIGVRTAMYTGNRKLTVLSSFLDGWQFALQVYGIESPSPLPSDFHDWAAYRLHFLGSTSGYKNMILERVPDEYAAVNRFYELLDEYRTRQPRVIARLPDYQGVQGVIRRMSDGSELPVKPPLLPYTLSLIAYTADPGFFVTFETDDPTVRGSGTFFPVLKWFEERFGVNRQDLEVLEPDTFAHWIDADAQYQEEFQQRVANKTPRGDS